MSKQEILNKLINNEDLTEEEIEFMVEEYEADHKVFTDITPWDTLVSIVLEVGKDLYYKVKYFESKTVSGGKKFPEQPRRVKKVPKTVYEFVLYDDHFNAKY